MHIVYINKYRIIFVFIAIYTLFKLICIRINICWFLFARCQFYLFEINVIYYIYVNLLMLLNLILTMLRLLFIRYKKTIRKYSSKLLEYTEKIIRNVNDFLIVQNLNCKLIIIN